jgi:hypothetical protein
VTAVARYALADYLRSQRFLPPLVTYLGFLAIFHATQGTVVPGYGAAAAALLPISVWLTLSLHNTEDPIQATVTVVNAGSHRRALFGKTYAALAGVLVLTAVALIWPALSTAHPPAPIDLAVGICAHLTCGLTGIALGTCCIRPLIKRQGYAFAAAAALSLIALVSRWLTPVNETIRLLSAAPPRPSATELLLLAAWALIMLLAVASLAARLGQGLPSASHT